MYQKPLISVVVPVYNVERYLNRCIDSILNQSFKEIEIILLNDGSKDSSLKILKEYELKDKRIIIIDKENEGLSETRNYGIKISRGKYITFIDSDDWIDTKMLESLYKEIEKNNADVGICSYSKEYENKSLDKRLDGISDIKIYNKTEVKNKLYRKIVGPIEKELLTPQNLDEMVTVWGKIYKLEILKKYNLNFISTKLIGTEDCLFNIMFFSKAQKAIFINKSYYKYWKGNIDSLTSQYKPKLKKQWQLLFELIEKELDKNKEEEIFYEALNNRICLSILGLGLNECSISNKKSHIDKIINLKDILNEQYRKEAMKNLELKYFPVHWKIFYFLGKNRLTLLFYLMLNFLNILRKYI